MAPRDEQDYERRRQQIIDGALRVFSQKGFEKATNKDIAEAAGIGSPGLIYHYFADKADLFRQVVERRVPLTQLFAQPEAFMALPPRQALTLFGQMFLRILEDRDNIAFLRMVIGEITRRPDLARMVNSIGPGRGFPLMTHYLAQQMEAGRLRRMDPGAAARCFIGPLLAFVAARELFPQADAQSLEPGTMVETLVEVFLRGMEV